MISGVLICRMRVEVANTDEESTKDRMVAMPVRWRYRKLGEVAKLFDSARVKTKGDQCTTISILRLARCTAYNCCCVGVHAFISLIFHKSRSEANRNKSYLGL